MGQLLVFWKLSWTFFGGLQHWIGMLVTNSLWSVRTICLEIPNINQVTKCPSPSFDKDSQWNRKLVLKSFLVFCKLNHHLLNLDGVCHWLCNWDTTWSHQFWRRNTLSHSLSPLVPNQTLSSTLTLNFAFILRRPSCSSCTWSSSGWWESSKEGC